MLKDLIKTSMPELDDDMAASAEQMIAREFASQGLKPTPEQLSIVLPQIVKQMKMGGGQQTQPQAPQPPVTPTWNATQEQGAAEDRYKSALAKIESRRKTSNVGQAMLSRFNPNRVEQNNKRFDAEAAMAKDDTIGAFERMNKAQQDQSTADWNTKSRARTETEWGQKDTDREKKLATEAEENDPNSEISTRAREVVGKLIPMKGNESYTSIVKVMPWVKDQLDESHRQKTLAQQADNNAASREERAAARDEARADRQLNRDIAQNNREEAADAKRQTQLDNNTRKYSEETAPLRNSLGLIDTMEATIGKTVPGFKFDSDDAKKADIPGVTNPITGTRYSFSDDAKDIEATRQQVKNELLKLRSGGAVTPQEAARLDAEFQGINWRDESDMIRQLGAFKKTLQRALDTASAGYSPEVTDRYNKRLQGTQAGSLPSVSTQEQYNAVPSGAEYIDARTGETKRKK